MLPALLPVVLKYQGQILVCVFGDPDYSNVISLLPEKNQMILAFEQIEIPKKLHFRNFSAHTKIRPTLKNSTRYGDLKF